MTRPSTAPHAAPEAKMTAETIPLPGERHDNWLWVRLTDDGQFIRKWDRKPFEDGTLYVEEGACPSLTAELARLRRELAERPAGVVLPADLVALMQVADNAAFHDYRESKFEKEAASFVRTLAARHSTHPRTVMRQQGQHVGAGFAEVCAACGRPVEEVGL